MNDEQLVSNIVDFNGIRVKYTWIPGNDSSTFEPNKQVYGIVFDNNGEVLVIYEEGGWKIPGGSPEVGESAEQTLKREFLEEADVTLKNIEFIGAQKVEFPDNNNPNKDQGNSFYQLRFIADIDQLLPSTPDPDGGEVHPRKFIKFDELTNVMRWGEVGKSMFETAHRRHIS